MFFVNREDEQRFLERKWNEVPQLIIIYGRRRVGKTTLIKKFLEGKRGVYLLVTSDSINENLKEIKNRFAELTGKDYFRDLDVGLVELFRYLNDEIDERIVIALDEFQYLMPIQKGVLSTFQKIWDENLANSKVFLILCGSSIGMMEHILEYRSPLYGRRTGQWKVTPFTVEAIKQMFPHKSPEEIIKIYSVLGGTPFYLDQVDGEFSVEENIKNKILSKGEILYEEPEFLLREELKEPRVYKLILKYIALGYMSLGEILNVTGLDRGNISRYLETLERLELLGYELPYGKRKRGKYYIRDNFFNFWFRFVYPNWSDLEIGRVDEVYNKILKDINNYYGLAFEHLVVDMLKLKLIDFEQETVLRWWHKGKEIDALAYNEEKMVMVEVKWKDLSWKEGNRILNDLERKSEFVDFKGDKEFCLIAKSVEGKDNLNALDLNDLMK